MLRFHIIEDGAVILRSRGVFRQAKLYRRGRELYASTAGGFVRLHKEGTSVPNLQLVDFDAAGFETEADVLGRWWLVEGFDGKRLAAAVEGADLP